MVDIYFEPNYGNLYEGIEKGKSIVYKYESDYGKIHHMFIKREIPNKVNGETYYDLVSPYGYGGPVIVSFKEGHKKKLKDEFIRDFDKYCTENKIISEFIRFHPIIQNAKDFSQYYHVSHIRNTVGTNLSDFEDPFQSEFSKSCRRNIRRAIRKGIEYEVIENPNDVSEFKEFYYSTMDRNNANDFYYFNDNYFKKCVELFKDNLILVKAIYNEKTIAMGFYFVYNDYIHIHLSGTLTEYLKLSPAYILRYAVTLWGKEKGYKLIHHGGGRTNDPEDSLYKFKKQFGKNTDFKFYVGKKIWNKSIYNQLCVMNNIPKKTDFFPAYRDNVQK